jgi:hypothetical protein
MVLYSSVHKFRPYRHPLFVKREVTQCTFIPELVRLPSSLFDFDSIHISFFNQQRSAFKHNYCHGQLTVNLFPFPFRVYRG